MKDQAVEKIKILRKIQNELKVNKTKYSKFGGFKYRSLEAILEELKKILPENCTITIDRTIEGFGNRMFVKAIACLYIPPYGNIISTAYAEIPDVNKKKMDEAQATGAASSYAGKYALEGLFLLDDGQDSDSLNKENNYKENNIEKIKKKINKMKDPEKLEKYMKELEKEDKETYLTIKAFAITKYKELKGEKENGN